MKYSGLQSIYCALYVILNIFLAWDLFLIEFDLLSFSLLWFLKNSFFTFSDRLRCYSLCLVAGFFVLYSDPFYIEFGVWWIRGGRKSILWEKLLFLFIWFFVFFFPENCIANSLSLCLFWSNEPHIGLDWYLAYYGVSYSPDYALAWYVMVAWPYFVKSVIISTR